MGWASALLGDKNPFAQYVAGNRYTMQGLGAGLASGTDLGTGLAGAAQGAANGARADDAYAMMQKENQQRLDQIQYERTLQQNALQLQTTQRNATADWAAKNGHPEWADALRNGAVSGSDVFNLMNKQTVVAPGSSVINGEGKTVMDGQNGQYLGQSMDAQNWNIVMKAQSDPSIKNSPAFAAAWNQLSQPKMTMQQTAQGLVPVMQAPNLPQGWGPSQGGAPAPQGGPAPMGGSMPSMMNGVPDQSFAQPSAPGAPPMMGGGVTAGAPVPGTAPRPDEAARRTGLLSTMITQALPATLKNYDALSNGFEQAKSLLPGGIANFIHSPEYRQASVSLKSQVSNLVYSLSGANSTPQEKQAKADEVTPVPGDDAGTIALKKGLLLDYVKAAAQQSTDPTVIKLANDTIAQLEAGSAPAATPAAATPGATASKVIGGVTYHQDANGDWYQ